MTCPLGYFPSLGNENLACKAEHCTVAEDLGLCCQPSASCETFGLTKSITQPLAQCLSNRELRSDAAGVYCAAGECTQADETMCCEVSKPRASCASEGVGLCTSNGTAMVRYSMRSGAENIFCASDVCRPAVDRLTCCIKSALCNTFICPTDYGRRDDKALFACKEARCTQKDDLDTCCFPEHARADPPPYTTTMSTAAICAVSMAVMTGMWIWHKRHDAKKRYHMPMGGSTQGQSPPQPNDDASIFVVAVAEEGRPRADLSGVASPEEVGFELVALDN